MKILKWALLAAAVLLAAAQFVQPDRTNPASDPAASIEAVAKPPEPVAAMFARACADCHSNRTAWPWYSKIAPVSWFVAGHVREGREKMNLSEWNGLSAERSRHRLNEACEETKKGGMPLWSYRLLHRGARVIDGEVAALCAWSGAPK